MRLATSQQPLSNLLDVFQSDLPSKPALAQVAQDAHQRLKRCLPNLPSEAQSKLQDELPGVWGSATLHLRQLLGRRDRAGRDIKRRLRHRRTRIGKTKPP